MADPIQPKKPAVPGAQKPPQKPANKQADSSPVMNEDENRSTQESEDGEDKGQPVDDNFQSEELGDQGEENKDPNDVLTEVDDEHPDGLAKPNMGKPGMNKPGMGQQPDQMNDDNGLDEDPMEEEGNHDYVKMTTHDGGKQFWYRDADTGRIIEKENAPDGHPDYDSGSALADLSQKVDMLMQKLEQLTGEDLESEVGMMGDQDPMMNQDDQGQMDEEDDLGPLGENNPAKKWMEMENLSIPNNPLVLLDK